MAIPNYDNYRLYVFLRSDLESMTPGKACAQVAHAASQAARDIGHLSWYQAWEKESREGDAFPSSMTGFGTTIVLDGGAFKDDGTDKIDPGLVIVNNDDWCSYGEVVDSTYPIRDGKKTHLIPLQSCYWLFIDPDFDPRVREWLNKFELYNGNHD